jgi:hypothetical protein
MLPVTLTVLLLPLFTDNLWEAGARLHARHFVLLGLLTVVPLVALLAVRLRREIGLGIRDVGSKILDDKNAAAARVTQRLVGMVDEADRDEARRAVEKPLERTYPAVSFEHVESARTRVSPSLGRRSLGRLVLTIIGLGLTVTAYIYVLAWVLVPLGTAASWADVEGVRTTEVDLLVSTLRVPVEPYLSVSALLGIVATAVLLAFVLTEEHYESNLSEALIRRPLQNGVELALPYLLLAERDPL